MTKKHFKQFADMIILLRKKETRETKIRVADVENLLVGVLQNDNSNFDTFKWDNYINKGLEKND